jgi:hypothetical protein
MLSAVEASLPMENLATSLPCSLFRFAVQIPRAKAIFAIPMKAVSIVLTVSPNLKVENVALQP